MTEQCGGNVYDWVCKQLNIESEQSNVPTVAAFAHALQKKNLTHYIHNPFYLMNYFYWKRKKIGNVSRKKIINLVDNESGLLVHVATAQQLYNINEAWTHFIGVKVFQGNIVDVYDPFHEELLAEYDGNKLLTPIEKLINDRHIMFFIKSEVSE